MQERGRYEPPELTLIQDVRVHLSQPNERLVSSYKCSSMGGDINDAGTFQHLRPPECQKALGQQLQQIRRTVENQESVGGSPPWVPKLQRVPLSIRLPP